MKMRATNGEGEWRVICEDGETHALKVRHLTDTVGPEQPGDYMWHAACDEIGGTALGRTPREAVQSIVRLAFWVPLEILGPEGSTPGTDWRPFPSCAEVLAHNDRTGGDCYGPWLFIPDEGCDVRVLWLAVAELHDEGSPDPRVEDDEGTPRSAEIAPNARVRPITRRGDALPWPEAN